MKLIILPGNSGMNKDWVEEVELALRGSFEKTHIQNYDHWQTGEKIINMGRELDKLVKTAEDLGDYAIFAKSVGTLLTLRGIYEKLLSPKFCIFTGIAVEWGRNLEFEVDRWLTNYNTPTLFIQKTEDPVISYVNLAQLLNEKNVSNNKLIEVPGNDHHYENVAQIKAVTIDFANSLNIDLL